MKKQLLILGAVMLSLGTQAQTYLPLKDFQDQSITSGGWQNFVVISNPGSYDWTTSDLGSTGNFYGVANGWNGAGGDDTELWLVSPPMDLTSATTPNLTFRNATNFSGPALQLMISSDYDGSSDPSVQGTWNDISGSVTWSAGGFAWTNSGNVDLSAYNGNNGVYIAYRYTSDPTNGSAPWEVDDIEAIEGAAPPPSAISIASVQATTGGDASDMLGDIVTVGGIVSAVAANGYYIQDNGGPWSGIYVYEPTGNYTAVRGDSIIVTGEVDEFAPAGTETATQIKNISLFTNVGNYAPYAPIVLSSAGVNDEMYESVLIQVQGVSCTVIPDGFNEWKVNDGRGEATVDDFIYLTAPTPVLNNVYDITGVMGHSFQLYKILPRDMADVVLLTGAGIEDITDLDYLFYPNPSNGTVNFNNNGNRVNIFNTLGQKVASTTASSIHLKRGVYLVQIGDYTRRLIVK